MSQTVHRLTPSPRTASELEGLHTTRWETPSDFYPQLETLGLGKADQARALIALPALSERHIKYAARNVQPIWNDLKGRITDTRGIVWRDIEDIVYEGADGRALIVPSSPERLIDQKFSGILGMHCLTSRNPTYGILKTLPNDFFADETRVRYAARFIFSVVLKCKTARDIEKVAQSSGFDLRKHGLSQFTTRFSPRELVEIAYPDITGKPLQDPPVRWWFLRSRNKWKIQGQPSMAYAGEIGAWILQFGLGAYSPETKRLIPNRLSDANLIVAFKRFGLRKLTNETIKPMVEVLELGAKQLGCRDSVVAALGKQAMPRSEIRKRSPDDIGNSVLKALRKTNPNFFDPTTNRLTAPGFRTCQGWTQRFEQEGAAIMRAAKQTYCDVLRRLTPEIFGWETDQIKPWEPARLNKWAGDTGTKLFRIAFAYHLAQSGIGTFDSSTANYRLHYQEPLARQKLQDLARDKCFSAFLRDSKLSGGFQMSAAQKETRRALRILFGCDPNHPESLTDPKAKPSTQSILLELLANNGILSFNLEDEYPWRPSTPASPPIPADDPISKPESARVE